LTHLLGSTVAWALAHCDLAAAWRPGERVFRRDVVVDGVEPDEPAVQLAAQTTDLHLAAAAPDARPMDRFGAARELRAPRARGDGARPDGGRPRDGVVAGPRGRARPARGRPDGSGGHGDAPRAPRRDTGGPAAPRHAPHARAGARAMRGGPLGAVPGGRADEPDAGWDRRAAGQLLDVAA